MLHTLAFITLSFSPVPLPRYLFNFVHVFFHRSIASSLSHARTLPPSLSDCSTPLPSLPVAHTSVCVRSPWPSGRCVQWWHRVQSLSPPCPSLQRLSPLSLPLPLHLHTLTTLDWASSILHRHCYQPGVCVCARCVCVRARIVILMELTTWSPPALVCRLRDHVADVTCTIL